MSTPSKQADITHRKFVMPFAFVVVLFNIFLPLKGNKNDIQLLLNRNMEPLNEISISKNTTSQTPWVSYVHGHLWRVLREEEFQSYVVESLWILLNRVSLGEFRKRVFHQRLMCDRFFNITHEEMCFPCSSVHFELKQIILHMHIENKIRIHNFDVLACLNFYFFLHVRNRLKIIITRMSVFDVPPEYCNLNITIIASGDHLALCGSYVHTDLYPQSNRVHLRLTYKYTPWYNFEATMDLTGTRYRTSLQLLSERNKRNLIHLVTHTFSLETGWAHNILIVAHKYQFVNLRLVGFKHSYFYDGFAALTEASQISTNIYVLNSSSFVCGLYLSIHTEVKQDPGVTYQLHTQSGVREIVGDETNSQIADTCSDRTDQVIASCRKMLILNSGHTDFHLKISFTYFNFQGVRGPDCEFGGVVFFDVPPGSSHTFKESISMCHTFHLNSLQNIYSAASSMMFVVYSFHNLSSINVSFDVSLTECFPVRHSHKSVQQAYFSTSEVHKSIVQFTPELTRKNFLEREDAELKITLDNHTCAIVQIQGSSAALRSISISKNISHSDPSLGGQMYKLYIRGFLFNTFLKSRIYNTLYGELTKPHFVAIGSLQLFDAKAGGESLKETESETHIQVALVDISLADNDSIHPIQGGSNPKGSVQKLEKLAVIISLLPILSLQNALSQEKCCPKTANQCNIPTLGQSGVLQTCMCHEHCLSFSARMAVHAWIDGVPLPLVRALQRMDPFYSRRTYLSSFWSNNRRNSVNAYSNMLVTTWCRETVSFDLTINVELPLSDRNIYFGFTGYDEETWLDILVEPTNHTVEDQGIIVDSMGRRSVPVVDERSILVLAAEDLTSKGTMMEVRARTKVMCCRRQISSLSFVQLYNIIMKGTFYQKEALCVFGSYKELQVKVTSDGWWQKEC